MNEISTSIPGRIRYCQIQLDKYDKVIGVACLSDKLIKFSNFEQLLGYHQSMLNSLVVSHNEGRFNDLIQFLSEEWSEILYLDRFKVNLLIMKRTFSLNYTIGWMIIKY